MLWSVVELCRALGASVGQARTHAGSGMWGPVVLPFAKRLSAQARPCKFPLMSKLVECCQSLASSGAPLMRRLASSGFPLISASSGFPLMGRLVECCQSLVTGYQPWAVPSGPPLSSCATWLSVATLDRLQPAPARALASHSPAPTPWPSVLSASSR